MLRRVSTYIRRQGLLTKSKPVLDVLLRAGYTCVVAHCNFHLRGEESNRDEQFVRDLCTQMKVTLEVEQFDTVTYARDHKESIEVAARELRYTWFAQLAETHRCQAIAVAHHQNDQAETLLLNLRRGTGLRGLAGIRPYSANPVVPDSVPVVRPLLCTTHDYIIHYLRNKRGLQWVEDSTNADISITRNAIRAQLQQYSKAEIEHMAQTAEYIQGYVDWLEGKETRQAALTRLYEELREYGFAEIDKIYDALQRGEGGKVFTSKTHQATIKHGKLCVTSV